MGAMAEIPDPAAATPGASVVIVAWQNHDALDVTLSALTGQSVGDFEVIVADNGAGLADRLRHWRDRLDIHHVDLGSNRGVSTARNTAAQTARSDVICFLDDDAEPLAEWVAALQRALEPPEVVAVRGRVVPQTASVLNELARAYDLGEEVRPAVLNTEGNCAITRSVFEAVGGFNEAMFGHEGAEISSRIVAAYGTQSIVYTPDAVIRHDYVSSLPGYLRKRFRHGRMIQHLDFGRVRQAAARSVRRSPWTLRRLALIPVKLAGVGAELIGVLWARVAQRQSRSQGPA